MGLAERLGLHAPFRTFADHNTTEHSERRRRKRGCSLSTSSLLEPAKELLNPQDNHIKVEFDGAGTRVAQYGHPLSDVNTGISDSPCHDPSPSEEPAKRYERRPRHKTKEDRYKVKKDGDKSTKQRARKDKRNGTDKRNTKGKRKEKSGDALMHTFSAPNIAQERLTVSAYEMNLFTTYGRVYC